MEKAKGKKKQMKKLMIAAAVAAMTAGAFAESCQEDPETPDCQTVFTVKFSGKTACENEKETYKTVQKISGSGYLVLSDYVTEMFTKFKVGKTDYAKEIFFTDGEVTKFSMFGKNLEKLMDDTGASIKPGKTYKVETDFGVKFEDQTDYAINVYQVAFGDAKVYITKGSAAKSSGCGEIPEVEGCIPEVTPNKLSGWFTAEWTPFCMDETGYSDSCVEFDEEIAVAGGTWSAKYDKKNSVKGEW